MKCYNILYCNKIIHDELDEVIRCYPSKYCVPPIIKQDDDKLNNRFSFLNLLLAFLNNQSFSG